MISNWTMRRVGEAFRKVGDTASSEPWPKDVSEEILACVGCHDQLVKHAVQLGFNSNVSKMIPNHGFDPRERSRTRWTRNVKCDRYVTSLSALGLAPSPSNEVKGDLSSAIQ